MKSHLKLFAGLLTALSVTVTLAGQSTVDDSLLSAISARELGPAAISGRVAALAVDENNAAVFYVGHSSGGVMKTRNGGMSWEHVFSAQGAGSVGAVAIPPGQPNVVWVGTGEPNNRQSSSWGDGIYKSVDAGRSWVHLGLRASHHIGRIAIDPTNPDVVYVAALGHLWGANRERGVFKSEDGGATWSHVLFINDDTGVADLVMDPANPNVLYAAAYQRRRSSWGFNGGGPHSGIYRTTDKGRTWTKLTTGLPPGDTGRIGLAVARSAPETVYAIVENAEGGVFRSGDMGQSWTRMNSLNPRPMYMSKIHVDPSNDNRVYVLGEYEIHASEDGGRTFFSRVRPNTHPAMGIHPDHHALWINPRDANHLIVGNDGGVWVTLDRGKAWDHLNNVSTAQIYRVAVDMQQLYLVYAGTQDNGTWVGPSATRRRIGITNGDWKLVIGGDGIYVAADPTDSRIVYANHQGGRLRRYDAVTGERKLVQPRPGPGEPPFRWNWAAPMMLSPHDPKTIYAAAQKLLKSIDAGHSWTAVSPDLTNAIDRDTLSLMGVPSKQITISRHDGFSAFGTITTMDESPKRAGLIYVGTDDGTIQVTRDGGGTWTDVTGNVKGVPKMLLISRVRASAFDEGTVYASFDGHQSDDFAAHLFMSADYGRTWTSIASDLPTGSVRTVCEDTRNPNLLYAGTEFGLFVSLDRGRHWVRWKSIPTVPVVDLVIHPRDNDLIVGTHGRGLFIVDDLTRLQGLTDAVLSSTAHLFPVESATQFSLVEDIEYVTSRFFRAPNPEFGAALNYYLRSTSTEEARLTILDMRGQVVRQLTGPSTRGLHRVIWDLRMSPPPPGEEPMTDYIGGLNPTILGPFVLPGEYRVRLSAAGQELSTTVTVRADPLSPMSDGDRRDLHQTLVALTEAQVTMEGAIATANGLDGELGHAQKTIQSRPQVASSIRTAASAAVAELRDVLTTLIGDTPVNWGYQAPSRYIDPGWGRGPSLRGRLNEVKDDIVRSHTVPTVEQRERVRQALQELGAVVARLERMRSVTVPELYKLIY